MIIHNFYMCTKFIFTKLDVIYEINYLEFYIIIFIGILIERTLVKNLRFIKLTCIK